MDEELKTADVPQRKIDHIHDRLLEHDIKIELVQKLAVAAITLSVLAIVISVTTLIAAVPR